MNLASFAELAVRLVNSALLEGGTDPLRTPVEFSDLVADRPFLAGPVTRDDLDRLAILRAELADIFAAAAAGQETVVAERLNALLVTHPLHPVIVSHDSERLHLHLHGSGSASDRYAAAAVIGLSMIVTQAGLHKLGVCSIAACDRVFLDGSSNRARRYCTEHSTSKTNVTALRGQPSNARDSGTDQTGESPASAAS